MNATNTRWTKAQEKRFDIREAVEQKVRMTAKELGVLLGAGLQTHIAWTAVSVAFGRKIDAAADAIAYDANTPTGHVQRNGKWERLTAADADSLTQVAQATADIHAESVRRDNPRRFREIAKLA